MNENKELRIGVEVVTIGQKCSPIDLKNGKKAIIIA